MLLKRLYFFSESKVLQAERFSDTVERLGFENVQSQLYLTDLLLRKDDIIGAQVHLVGGATC